MEDREDLEASAQEDELESNATPVPPEESNEETESREPKRKKKAKKKKIKSKKVIVGDNVEIDEEDIIQHAVPEREKKVVPSKKQDFFVQSAITGKFARVKDAQKIVQELHRQEEEENEVTTDGDSSKGIFEVAEIGDLKLHLTVRRLNYMIFTLLLFADGMLAGVSVFNFILTLSGISNPVNNLTWLGFASPWTQRVHNPLASFAVVWTGYLMVNELRPPLIDISVLAQAVLTYESPFQEHVFRHSKKFETSKSERLMRNINRERKAILIVKFIGIPFLLSNHTVYLIGFTLTWVASSQEDHFALQYNLNPTWYYSSTNTTQVDTGTFMTRYIVYETFNISRLVFALFGWLFALWLWWSDRRIVNRNERTLQIYHELAKSELTQDPT